MFGRNELWQRWRSGITAVVVLVATLSTSPSASGATRPGPAEACLSAIPVTAPATDFAEVVARQPEGTCFRLAAGTYRFGDVVPKDHMSFVGASAATVIIDGSGRENAFHGTANGVTITQMTFQDFNDSGGTSRQEQAPIRGTARLWASERGQLATNWLISDIVSRRNYASGIFLGDNFTVRNSTFYDNGVTGIGGDDFVGGLIEQNTIYGNGRQQASGALVNGGGIKFTQAGTPSAPIRVVNNELYDNPNIAIWCDIGCQGMEVLNNNIREHVSRAVMYELSANLVVRGNTIVESNTWTGFRGDFNAGAITVGESRNALVEGNLIRGAKAGVVLRQTKRPSRGEGFLANYDGVQYVVEEVTVRNNRFEDTGSIGISLGTTGAGLIVNPGSIRFTNNSYDSPETMTFWGMDSNPLTYSQWRAAGYDLISSETPTIEPFVAPQKPSEAPPPTVVEGDQPSGSTTTSGVQPVEIPFRLNAGGGRLDQGGVVWQADSFYVDGNVARQAEGIEIRQTDADELYRFERWGSSGYKIPIKNGTYRVILHHAEIFAGCQVQDCRRFSVEIEGVPIVRDLDIYDTAGGYTAFLVERRQVVTDGELTISFASSKQESQIAAIEILPVDSDGPVPQTTVPTSPGKDQSVPPETESSATTTPEFDKQNEATSNSVSPRPATMPDLSVDTTGSADSPTTQSLGESDDNVNRPSLESDTPAGLAFVEVGYTDEKKPLRESGLILLPAILSLLVLRLVIRGRNRSAART